MTAKNAGPSGFDLLRQLAQPGGLPPEAHRALRALRVFIKEKGGKFSRSQLSQLEDPLARTLAEHALHHHIRATAIAEGPPIPFEAWSSLFTFLNGNFEALNRLIVAHDEPVDLGPIDGPWFANAYTRALSIVAWNNLGDSPGPRGPGASKRGPSTSDLLRAAEPELVRLNEADRALRRALSSNSDAPMIAQLRSLRRTASQNALAAGITGAVSSAHLSHGATRAPAELRAVYEWVSALAPKETLGPSPEVSTAVLKRLGTENLYPLRVIASRATSDGLGDLPVLRATTRALRASGVLEGSAFAGMVVRLRSHALPSFERLIGQMLSNGLRNYEVDASKGVSSNPLTVAALERTGARVDGAFGDSWLSPERLAEKQKKSMLRGIREARRTGQPLLVLGEGYASARALYDVARKVHDVRIGYVAFTQSGLNFLREVPALPFFVESLADSELKKRVEGRPLGRWVVERELELESVEKGRPPEERVAAVIGYGESVGPGIAAALREKGFKEVVVVDRSAERLAVASRNGFSIRLASEDGRLPGADLYFTAAGQPNVLGEVALRSAPDGAIFVVHGSSVESDRHFIHAARRGQVSGVSARALEPSKLRDHRSLEMTFARTATRIRLRKMGQPFYDGRLDKDLLLVDVYMAGLFAAMAVAANKLRTDPAPHAIHTLDRGLQRAIANAVGEHYGVASVPDLGQV